MMGKPCRVMMTRHLNLYAWPRSDVIEMINATDVITAWHAGR